MREKLKNDKFTKELFYKLLAILLLAGMALLFFDVLSLDKDGRRQIVDRDGAAEYTASGGVLTGVAAEEQRLEEILGQMKGVGQVQVMIVCREPAQTVFSDAGSDAADVKGVVVVAEGAGNPVVKSDLIKAVTTAYDLPAGSVTVFENK